MYPNQCVKNQRGFLMPLAIFILVVMSLFALVLSRNTVQTATSSTQEMTNVQAFYAAESGAQSAMNTLFYSTSSTLTRQSVDSRCVGLNTTYNYTVPGLNACSAVVTCSCQYQDASTCAPAMAANYVATATTTKLSSTYQIVSVGTCGSGNLRSVRTIEAGSFLEQE